LNGGGTRSSTRAETFKERLRQQDSEMSFSGDFHFVIFGSTLQITPS
jgi:hypothetical protein